MAQALTGTSAIYALIDRDGGNHRKATSSLRASMHQGIIPLITNFIIAVSHALMLSRPGAGIARDWLSKQIWPIEPVTPADEKKAKEIIQCYTDKGFSKQTPLVSRQWRGSASLQLSHSMPTSNSSA